MRVLLTDADNRATLAAARSLRRAGHTVLAAGESRRSLAGLSRCCSTFVQSPSPTTAPQAFVDAMVAAASAHSVDVLLPMTEVTTLLLTEHRTRLPTSCRLPFADADAISLASNKAAVMERARHLGIPVPATLIVPSSGSCAHFGSGLSFPIVVKPSRSRVLTHNGWIASRVSYASSEEQLNSMLEKLDPAVFPVLLQERVHGPGVGVFACYCDGRPVALFSHRRLREKPPSGGVSVLSESTPLDPQAVSYATRLLDDLGWHGVAMVEFKRDDRNGSLRLLEINSRFWGSLQLAINSGVDFPRIVVDSSAGRLREPVFNYRVGVRNRWLLGDLDALLSVLFRSRSSLNLPAGFPGRGRLLWDFLHFFGRDLHYEIWSLKDPRPGLLELGRWLTRR